MISIFSNTSHLSDIYQHHIYQHTIYHNQFSWFNEKKYHAATVLTLW